MDEKIEKVTKVISKVQEVINTTQKTADEEKNREARCNNIIMYRMPESSFSGGLRKA